MKKLLSIVLAVIMAVSCLAVTGSAFANEERSVSVDVSLVYEGELLLIPSELEVEAGISDRYAEQIGFNDNEQEPTVLDAIITLHTVIGGDEFMEEFPLSIGASGWINNFLGFGSALSYYKNTVSVLSLTEALDEGDVLEFDFYSDTTNWSDKYIFTDERYMTAQLGKSLELTFKSDTWGTIAPAAGLTVLVDDVAYGTTDKDGKISIVFDSIENHFITAEGTIGGAPIFTPWCVVTASTRLFDDVNNRMEAAAQYLLNSGMYDSGFTTENATDFLLLLKSGVDMSEYEEQFVDSVKDNLERNDGKLLKSVIIDYSTYETEDKEDIGLYAAAIQSLYLIGYDPTDFYGHDITDYFDHMDYVAGSYSPYYYRIALETCGFEMQEKILEDAFHDYTMGKGFDYYGFSCDNTATFLGAIALFDDEYTEYVTDAKKIIKHYSNNKGAFYSDTYKTENADSTGLALMAFSKTGSFANAFRYYKNLIDSFSSETGAFRYDGADNIFATKDALLGLESFSELIYFGDYDYPTGWVHDEDGWYLFSNQNVMLKGWQKVDGKWYYLNADGVMATGWKKVGNYWYYLNTSGAMQTGWKKISGKWYYFNPSGAMVTGWKKVSGKWYYFNSSGAMQTGWQKISGKWYYLNASGAMVTGWQKISGKWYYFNAGGDMKTGWLQFGGKWYYLNQSGAMVTGSAKIGSKTYRFNASGVCLNP